MMNDVCINLNLNGLKREDFFQIYKNVNKFSRQINGIMMLTGVHEFVFAEFSVHLSWR